MNASPTKPAFCVWMTVLTLIGIAMRWLWIDRPSFWIDELFSVMHTTRFGDGNLTKQLGYVPTLITLTLADVLPERSLSENPEQWRAIGVTHTL
ncbi:MAG: hypothetical protein AAFN41_04150, partial [Planctomycetota bacterium]